MYLSKYTKSFTSVLVFLSRRTCFSAVLPKATADVTKELRVSLKPSVFCECVTNIISAVITDIL